MRGFESGDVGLKRSRVVQPQNLILVRYRSITYCSTGFMLIGEENMAARSSRRSGGKNDWKSNFFLVFTHPHLISKTYEFTRQAGNMHDCIGTAVCLIVDR